MAKPGGLWWGILSAAISAVVATAFSLIVVVFCGLIMNYWTKAAADAYRHHHPGQVYDNLIPGILLLLLGCASWIAVFLGFLLWRWVS
jgi:phosphatidylglycerophosphatase A